MGGKKSHTRDDFMESAFFYFFDTGWDGGAFPTMSDDGLVCFVLLTFEIKKVQKESFFVYRYLFCFILTTRALSPSSSLSRAFSLLFSSFSIYIYRSSKREKRDNASSFSLSHSLSACASCQSTRRTRTRRE